jgi:hypothetical protein
MGQHRQSHFHPEEKAGYQEVTKLGGAVAQRGFSAYTQALKLD